MLDEFEEFRLAKNPAAKPNVIHYTSVAKNCLLAGDNETPFQLFRRYCVWGCFLSGSTMLIQTHTIIM